MFCTKCGFQLPDESTFCSKCGVKLGPDGPPSSPGAAPPTPASKEPEETVWQGCFSARSVAHYWMIYGIYVILGLYVLLAMLKPQVTWMQWASFAALVVPAMWIGWEILFLKVTVKYKLTNYRFFKETGFISRKIAELELIRVDDVQVSQNILQRMFDVGNILIISTDATDPKLLIEGIAAPVQVKEQIRANVRKRRSGAFHMESL